MKILLLCAMLGLSVGGDRERGLQLYREGKFAEAAAAFRDAIAAEGDSAELQYNLALAQWRAGQLAEAETAVEKYAALAAAPRPDLHRGVLGAVRYDEARALQSRGDGLLGAAQALQPRSGGTAPSSPSAEDPLAVFEQALAKATQSRDYFVQGAASVPTPELLRNTERALRLIDELQKKIDELKQQREQQKKDQEQKDSEAKDDKESKDDQQKPKESPQPEPKQDDKGEQKAEPKDPGQAGEPPPAGDPGEGKPEPKPGESPEPKPGEGEPQQAPPPEGEQKAGEPKQQQGSDVPPDSEAKEPQQRHDAPGEAQKGKELSPEQTQRLLEQARELDQKLQQIRARASKSSRRAVERDW
jgi:tetratricopeptide (TPR) repeat protein